MRLLIKQKVFAWTDSYDVLDEMEDIRYQVKAEFFAFGHQLKITNLNGTVVGEIHQKLLTFMPTFEFVINGLGGGLLRKELTFLRPKYILDYRGWTVKGDMMGWEYDVINSQGRIVAHITKELFHWGDTYAIDILDSKDEMEALMVVIAIDAANCSENN